MNGTFIINHITMGNENINTIPTQAETHFEEAEKWAGLLKDEKITATDLLHREALEEHFARINKDRNELYNHLKEVGREEATKEDWLGALRLIYGKTYTDHSGNPLFAHNSEGIDLGIVPAEFRDDKDFMLEAIKIAPGLTGEGARPLISYASERLLGDKDFLLDATKIPHGMNLGSAPIELRGDEEFVLSIIEASSTFGDMTGIAKELRTDKEFILKAMRISNGKYSLENIIGYGSDSKESVMFETRMSVRGDREFMQEAITLNEKNIEYLSKELVNDIEFLAPLVKVHPSLAGKIFERIEDDAASGVNIGFERDTTMIDKQFADRFVAEGGLGVIQYLPRYIRKELAKNLGE